MYNGDRECSYAHIVCDVPEPRQEMMHISVSQKQGKKYRSSTKVYCPGEAQSETKRRDEAAVNQGILRIRAIEVLTTSGKSAQQLRQAGRKKHSLVLVLNEL